MTLLDALRRIPYPARTMQNEPLSPSSIFLHLGESLVPDQHPVGQWSGACLRCASLCHPRDCLCGCHEATPGVPISPEILE